jgi:hypothetical protein
MFASRLGRQVRRTCPTMRPLQQSRLPLPSPSTTRSFRMHARFQRQYQYSRFQQSSTLFYRWAARPTFYYEIGGLSLCCAGFYAFNLETVPVSGRKRFNFITPDQEASVSQQQYSLIMQQYRGKFLPESDKRVRRVRHVLERLIPSSGMTGLDWEVHVIESDEPNAFVIPGYVVNMTDFLTSSTKRCVGCIVSHTSPS